MAKKVVNQPESLSKPQNNSFLCQKTYACSFGPEDYRDRLPEVLTQQQRPTGSRLGIRGKGTSRKRGCLSGFTISQLYLWPDIAHISTKHSQHTDSAGNLVHGSGIAEQQVKHNHAPAVSDRMKDWVRIQLFEENSAQQIMAKHAKSALPRIENGTADRDCYLDTQTIRNIGAKQAKFTWKRHPNEAQSVRLFYQEHSEHTFIYQEEQSSQPQQAATAQPASSAEHQVSRRFVFGWTTPAMLANILQYGNDNVVLLDATFGTNHMKMPLYTGLVMDDFGNGLPGFMILCQGVSEDDITTWLQALLKKLRLELHDWMCSCVMVDDAIAEINAIK